MVKHLIQGRNKETWVRVEPLTLRSWPSENRRSEPLGHATIDLLLTMWFVLFSVLFHVLRCRLDGSDMRFSLITRRGLLVLWLLEKKINLVAF